MNTNDDYRRHHHYWTPHSNTCWTTSSSPSSLSLLTSSSSSSSPSSWSSSSPSSSSHRHRRRHHHHIITVDSLCHEWHVSSSHQLHLYTQQHRRLSTTTSGATVKHRDYRVPQAVRRWSVAPTAASNDRLHVLVVINMLSTCALRENIMTILQLPTRALPTVPFHMPHQQSGTVYHQI